MRLQIPHPLTWLEAHSRWSNLRSLGQSGLVKASVLMPAFGYILLLNENVHQYLTIKFDGWLLHYVPSIWRVWLLFYGTFLLAIGSILFNWNCPVEVKRYASAFRMADSERGHRVNQYQDSEVRKNLRSLYAGMSKWEEAIFPLQKLQLDAGDLGIQSADHTSRILIDHWTLTDIKRPSLRIIIFLLFWTGLILLAVPAVITFVQVTILSARHLLT
jgi:hypothetical protein